MTYDEISCFCMQIYFLIHAGMDVNDALSLTSEEIKAKWFEKISRQADEGASFSEALKASGVFPIYVWFDRGGRENRASGKCVAYFVRIL